MAFGHPLLPGANDRSWPNAAELTQAATFGAEMRQMLPPRPHADLDPCADREGILLNCAQGRPRTHATFKPADGALCGPHLPGHFLLRHEGLDHVIQTWEAAESA